MAYHISCYSFLFFSDTIKPTYKLSQLYDKSKQNRKNCWISWYLSCRKVLELYYDVTVKFSLTLKKKFWAKQQDIKLELASLS